MITHKTFTRKTGLTPKSILKAQEEVRAEVEAFIARELNPDDVVNVTESAVMVPFMLSWTLISVTVWYKKAEG